MAKRRSSGGAGKEDLPKAKINKKSLANVKKLLKYIHPYRFTFIIGMIFLFLSSITLLAFPALLGAMIDAAQGKQTYDWLPVSIGTIGLICFTWVFPGLTRASFGLTGGSFGLAGACFGLTCR